MNGAGHTLWHAGYIVGPDRANGASPFEYGSDAVVGIATALQIGGQLVEGAVTLLTAGNRYAAMALIRQLVEVEYVGWAFAEDQQRTGDTWLRSSDDERRKMWQPRHLRESSAGRFRGSDYGSHCELGGHPTPKARQLLPDHSDELHEGWIWFELCRHGNSAWDYLASAVEAQDYGSVVLKLPAVASLHAAWKSWQTSDLLLPLADEVQQRLDS